MPKVERTDRMPDLERKTIHRTAQKLDEMQYKLNEKFNIVNEVMHIVH